MGRARIRTNATSNGATLGFESTLWATADKLRGHMDSAEYKRENPSLKGVLPKDYARPALDKQRLGELIDLIGTIGLGDLENRSKDILGRVYEYFLSQFASAEGRKLEDQIQKNLKLIPTGRS